MCNAAMTNEERQRRRFELGSNDRDLERKSLTMVRGTRRIRLVARHLENCSLCLVSYRPRLDMVIVRKRLLDALIAIFRP